MDEPKQSSEAALVSATAEMIYHDYVSLLPKENMIAVAESPALQLPDDASSTSGYASDSSSISPYTSVLSATLDSKCPQQSDLAGAACIPTSSTKKAERELTMLERKFNSVSKGLWGQKQTQCHQIGTNSKIRANGTSLKCEEVMKNKMLPVVQRQKTDKPQLESNDSPATNKMEETINAVAQFESKSNNFSTFVQSESKSNSFSTVDETVKNNFSTIDETINSVVAAVGASDLKASVSFSGTKNGQQLDPVTIMDVLLAPNGNSAINLANSLQLQQIGTFSLPPNFNLENFVSLNVASLDFSLTSSGPKFGSDLVSKRDAETQTDDENMKLQKFPNESDSEDEEENFCHRLAPKIFPKRQKLSPEIESQADFYFDSRTAATSSATGARCRPFNWTDTQTCARVHPFFGRRVYLRPEDSCARTRAVEKKWLKEFNWFYSLGHPARELPHIPRLNARSFKRLMISEAKAKGSRINYKKFATANRQILTGFAKEITETQLILASELSPFEQYAKYKEEKIWPYAVRCGFSKIHGIGCFATCDIPAKALFLEYYGELIRNTLCDLREAKYGKQKGLARMYVNMFTVDSEFTIDATMKGCVARFINHSCSPNAVAKVITYEARKRLLLIAKRTILAGEEICYDYKLPSEPENRIPCCCKASKCRGFMN